MKSLQPYNQWYNSTKEKKNSSKMHRCPRAATKLKIQEIRALKHDQRTNTAKEANSRRRPAGGGGYAIPIAWASGRTTSSCSIANRGSQLLALARRVSHRSNNGVLTTLERRWKLAPRQQRKAFEHSHLAVPSSSRVRRL